MCIKLPANGYRLRNSINCIHRFFSLGGDMRQRPGIFGPTPFVALKKKKERKKRKTWHITSTRFFPLCLKEGSAEQ
jgi:hypothetical protein